VANHFPLFLTLDCGNSWERRKTLPKALPGEVVFADSNSALFLGEGEDMFITGGASGARLLTFMTYVDFSAPYGQKPTNPPPYQINSWFSEKIEEAHRSISAGAYSMGWIDDGHGPVIVGGDAKRPDQVRFTAWHASDLDSGPVFLVPAKSRPRGYRSAVQYDAVHKTWIAVGPNGTDISTDHGRHWRPLVPNPKDGDVRDADRNWTAISLPYVVGPNGRIGKLREGALATHEQTTRR
jgi:hypothetical protein